MDAGLVGRLTMDEQCRWPSDDKDIPPSKMGECVGWLAVLADRTEMNYSDCAEEFLKERLFSLDGSFRIIGKAKMQIWY